jgi:hypothetical protein
VPSQLLESKRTIVIYGEPLFAEAVADQLGLLLLEPPIDWLTTLPTEYRLRELTLMSLGDARACEDSAFVKPADGKIFEAKVYARGKDLPAAELVDPDIPVLRSEVVDFRLEVRCFIHEGRIASLSPYWRDDALAQSSDGDWPFETSEADQAVAFANSVIADPRVALPPGCTLDIGRISGGAWAVIEANPAWGAGLYGSDPKQVLTCVQAAIRRPSDASAADVFWVSRRRHSGTQR